MAYEAPKTERDQDTPRLRNLALYAVTLLTALGIESHIGCSPVILAGTALIGYGIMFNMLNPDIIMFDKNDVYKKKIRKDLLLTPLKQPFKDALNLVKIRKIKV